MKDLISRGLSKEDKDKLRLSLTNSILIQQLKSVLDQWERELIQTKSDYDNPSWSHKQAHLNGMSEILSRLKSILSLDQKD